MNETSAESAPRSRLLRALDRSPFEPYSGASTTSRRPRTTSDEIGYTGTQAAEVVGITYRQLDYWARTDLIRPSVADAHGEGSGRRYSYSNLLELRVIKSLLDAGIRLESVREVFEYLRDSMSTDIASAHLVISGDSVVLARGDELVDVLRSGQGVQNVLSLAAVKDDVDNQLVPIAQNESA